MFTRQLQLLCLSALVRLVLTQSPNSNDNETVRAIIVFHNTCNRTSFIPSTSSASAASINALTNAGANDCYNSGSFYRSRYLDNARKKYIAGMPSAYDIDLVNAFVPDQPLYMQGGTAFMQGLYPPIMDSDIYGNESGSDTVTPLNGYQYFLMETVSPTDPMTIYLRGGDQCPNAIADRNSYYATEEFQNMNTQTKDYYQAFYNEYLAGIFDKDNVEFASAYQIYDYLAQNYASNETISAIAPEDLNRLRYLASDIEFNKYANTTTSSSRTWSTLAENGTAVRDIGGRTLAGGFLGMFQDVIQNDKFNRLTFTMGNFDTMLSWFAITNLTQVSDVFTQMPQLGASMVLELVSTSDDPNRSFDEQTDGLFVRFGFRNDTDVLYYPLFGSNNTVMSWQDWRTNMATVALGNPYDWCNICQSTALFCRLENTYTYNITVVGNGSESSPVADNSVKHHNVSPAVGGVIGAIVTLFVAALAFACLSCCCGVTYAVTKGKKERRRRPSFIDTIRTGSFKKSEKRDKDMELALSPRAATMGERYEDDDFEHDYDFDTMSSTATAVQLQRPGPAHFKEVDGK